MTDNRHDGLFSFGMSPARRGLSVGLRIGSLAAKFFSIFLIARFLAPADFGMYGLVAAGVAYATYAAGADFYTFANREFICAVPKKRGQILKQQAVALGLTYLVVIPLVTVAFACGLLPWTLFGWFLVLLFMEHMGQEVTRLLIASGHALAAAVVLFFRTGLWPLIAILLMWTLPELRNLGVVLGCWAISGVLGVLLAMHLIRRQGLHGWAGPLDWFWIRRGFRVAGWFLVSSLGLRALFSADRFWVEAIATPEVLGVYVFYMSIAGALPALLEAGVFAFEYPGMVATYPSMSPANRRNHAVRLLLKVAALSIAYSAVILLALPLALRVVNRPEYVNQTFLLIAGIGSAILYVMSLAPHFALYALRNDRSIVAGNILAALAFFPTAAVLHQVLPVEHAVALGLCMSFLVLLVWKLQAFLRGSGSRSEIMTVI